MNFFKDLRGNLSSSRLITFIIVIVALIYSGAVIWFGRESVMLAAAAAGTLFTTIAGPGLVWMYNQKKNENKIE